MAVAISQISTQGVPTPITFSLLVEKLQDLPPNVFVAVEGFMRSGKSYLALELAASLQCSAIHTDDFVEPGEVALHYVERLNASRLGAALSSAYASTGPVLVEGICLRDVLQRVGVVASVFVYVKRMAISGLWHDGLHLEDFESGDQSFSAEPQQSDFRYHVEQRPHERANYFVCRVEQAAAL